MTAPKNFLERWARKKAEAQRDTAEAPGTSTAASDVPAALGTGAAIDAPASATDAAKSNSVDAPARQAQAMPASSSAPESEFDLASLPSLESITAATDMRGFLTPGVPPELSRAALRRAWLADPAIRDFVGLQENDWDFTNPAAVPGFGDIPPGYDIKKMIAQIFGETKQTSEQAAEQTAPPPGEQPSPAEPQPLASTPESPPSDTPLETASASEASADVQPVRLSGAAEPSANPYEGDFVRRKNDIASQQNASESTPNDSQRRRQHGGALPRS